MGNRRSEKTGYNVIAEMLALKSICESDKTVKWASEHMGNHDLESDFVSIEVKSTIKKSDTNVTISSQHQLKSERPLFLYFCRLEESAQGVSINNVKNMLVNFGYPESYLNIRLKNWALKWEQQPEIRNIGFWKLANTLLTILSLKLRQTLSLNIHSLKRL